MATKLKIIWDGDVKGLAEHRISVSAFGPAITRLTRVLRRIASDIVKNGLPNSQRSAQGNYASEAKKIDIEIESIEVGSSGIGAVITFTPEHPYQFSVFGNLDERVALEFVDSVDKESKGIWQDQGVRKYLQDLPQGLTKQVYSVTDGQGTNLRMPVEIADVHLTDIPRTAPNICRHYGNIIAIGFEPGKTEVRVKRLDGKTVTFAATPDQVQTAWELRDVQVKALSVYKGQHRLLKLQQAEEEDFEVTPEAVNTHIFQRWDNVLRRLAQ